MILLSQMFTTQTYAIAFLIIGILIKYLIGQRRFNRRVLYKTYRYNNFFFSLVIPFAEWIVGFCAWLMIVLGILLLLV
jgi:hypothetical protein